MRWLGIHESAPPCERGRILNVYVDPDTMRKLESFSEASGRSVEELAEAAVANEASKAH